MSYPSIIASAKPPPLQRYDVLIAGGAVMGSSVALFLKRLAPACTVAVVEPDDACELASTLRASGGAELIVHRRFQTIDLSRLGYARVAANQPYAERGIL